MSILERQDHTKSLVRGAIIAAIYAALTLALAPISYGAGQLRVAEALTVLPFVMPRSAVPGLFVGCLLANLFGGGGIWDIVFGAVDGALPPSPVGPAAPRCAQRRGGGNGALCSVLCRQRHSDLADHGAGGRGAVFGLLWAGTCAAPLCGDQVPLVAREELSPFGKGRHTDET